MQLHYIKLIILKRILALQKKVKKKKLKKNFYLKFFLNVQATFRQRSATFATFGNVRQRSATFATF